MKIILSRKGFDSGAGSIASPILDGSPVSLPIHDDRTKITYDDLHWSRSSSLGKVVEDLTVKRKEPTKRSDTVHLDPDLRRSTLPRASGWRPLYGPHPRSHAHMMKQGVEEGDLVLFFGWFRKVELDADTGIYRFGGEDLHVLFGWLQIDKIVPAGIQNRKNVPKWAWYHPHFQDDWENNYVYTSAKQLSLPGLRRKLPGGGTFDKYCDDLRLTAPGCSRSIWQLPRAIFPKRGQQLLSFHSNPKLWKSTGTHTRLQTQKTHWQDAVLHADECPEAIAWARGLITRNG